MSKFFSTEPDQLIDPQEPGFSRHPIGSRKWPESAGEVQGCQIFRYNIPKRVKCTKSSTNVNHFCKKLAFFSEIQRYDRFMSLCM
jgi:hypothetical protein